MVGGRGSKHSPQPPLGQAPGADPLHAALQVEQRRDGLLQTLLVLLVLAALLQLLQGEPGWWVCVCVWVCLGVQGGAVKTNHITQDHEQDQNQEQDQALGRFLAEQQKGSVEKKVWLRSCDAGVRH